MKRLWIFCFVGFLLGGCVHAMDSEGREDRLMRAIEKKVVLPAGAKPLARYRRNYGWANEQNEDVRAIYELSDRPRQIWVKEEDLPIILDGGCSVITFRYNVGTAKVADLRCN